MFEDLVMIGPSPRYIDDGDYVGGFTEPQIHELLDFLDSNYMGWSQAMAPVIMGNPDRPELGDELTNSFCRTDPEIASDLRGPPFLSDNRADLQGLSTRTLILQCSEDVIAPQAVGEYVHRMLPRERAHHPECDRALPKSERPRGDRCRNASIYLSRADLAPNYIEDDLEDLFDNAPCGYVSMRPDGRITKINRTLSLWLQADQDRLVGKRFQELLNITGKIYYETHFAPLLRMQGFFNEVALDLASNTGQLIPVLVNAVERRDGSGQVRFVR